MSFPATTVLTADINGVYGEGRTVIPDPLTVGTLIVNTISSVTGSVTVDGTDIFIMGAQRSRTGMFSNQDANQYLTPSASVDTGLYYVNADVGGSKFLIGEYLGAADIAIGSTIELGKVLVAPIADVNTINAISTSVVTNAHNSVLVGPENQAVGLFGGNASGEFITPSVSSDCGVYYVKGTAPVGNFLIGELGAMADVTISSAEVAFSKSISAPNIFSQQVYHYVATWTGMWTPTQPQCDVYITRTGTVFTMHIGDFGLVPATIASGYMTSDPFIPESFMNSAFTPSLFPCLAVDATVSGGDLRAAVISIDQDVGSGNYYIACSPTGGGGNFSGVGGAPVNLRPCFISWSI